MSKREVFTKIRVVALFVLWVLAASFEANIIPVNEVTTRISEILTFAVSVWCMWKNNSFTPEAKTADVLLDALKSGAKLTTVETEDGITDVEVVD